MVRVIAELDRGRVTRRKVQAETLIQLAVMAHDELPLIRGRCSLRLEHAAQRERALRALRETRECTRVLHRGGDHLLLRRELRALRNRAEKRFAERVQLLRSAALGDVLPDDPAEPDAKAMPERRSDLRRAAAAGDRAGCNHSLSHEP